MAAYTREWPAGCLGYTNSARRNATVLQPLPALASPQSAADVSQPSARSLRRWWNQVGDVGRPCRSARPGWRPAAAAHGQRRVSLVVIEDEQVMRHPSFV